MSDQRNAHTKGARPWLWVFVVSVLFLGIPYGRALIESRAALSEGDNARDTDVASAIVSYRHAVEWYAPLNPYSRAAVERLREIGDEAAESEEGSAVALQAYEGLRSGILLTRWLATPYAETVEEIEPLIAQLRAGDDAQVDAFANGTETSRQLELLRSSRDRAPSPFWSIVSTGAFLAWILLTWLAIGGARTRSERTGRTFRIRATLASVAALGIWITGLNLV